MLVYFISGVLIALTEVLIDNHCYGLAAGTAMIWAQCVFTYIHKDKL